MNLEPNARSYEQNAILASLSCREYRHLQPHFETVSLRAGQNLYNCGDRIRHVYFPLDAVFWLFTTMEDGATIETGVVGSEGVVGISSVLGAKTSTCEARALTKNKAVRIRAEFLKEEFDAGGALHDLILRYFHALYVQISQTGACNRHHKMEGRLCRWLLMMHDRNKSDELRVTQEFIAEMLGTRRPYVTTAAGILQKQGIIKCGRGAIRILDRGALENCCCECYEIIREEFAAMNSRRAAPRH
ncbi:MAG TPA: Crp/Fnr family transcriptional regulator [Pyrinomonadaceae bacterium]|jgi:CRP-like cAMP-binding protein